MWTGEKEKWFMNKRCNSRKVCWSIKLVKLQWSNTQCGCFRNFLTVFKKRVLKDHKLDTEGQQAHEKCSTPLIKTTMRDHLTPIRMLIIKNVTNNKCGKDIQKKGILYITGGNVNWCSYFGIQYGDSPED